MTDLDFINQYELSAFRAYYFSDKMERWVPGFGDAMLGRLHRQRYELAADFVKDKSVLDIACGCGFGSYALAVDGRAACVTGGDINADSVKYAGLKYTADNLNFQVIDAAAFDMENQFDLIVSFETIEHFSAYEKFLANISRALKHNGRLIISTPISTIDFNADPVTEAHTQEWGFKAFQELICKHLTCEKIWIQAAHGKSLFHKFLWLLKCKCAQFLNIRTPRSDYYKYIDVKLEEYTAAKWPREPQKGYQIILARKSHH